MKGTRFGDAHSRSVAQALPNQFGRKREQEKITVTLPLPPSLLGSSSKAEERERKLVRTRGRESKGHIYRHILLSRLFLVTFT